VIAIFTFMQISDRRQSDYLPLQMTPTPSVDLVNGVKISILKGSVKLLLLHSAF
jgi:hypothetical protein